MVEEDNIVFVKDLTKKYKTGKLAVSDVSLKIKSG